MFQTNRESLVNDFKSDSTVLVILYCQHIKHNKPNLKKRYLNLDVSRGFSFIKGVTSTAWSLQLDHLKLCTGSIGTHLLEFDHTMITSQTHSLLGTDTDMYGQVDKAIKKCNYYFCSVSPSNHPSFCLCLSVHMTQLKWTRLICAKIDITDFNENLQVHPNYGYNWTKITDVLHE